MSSTDFNSVFSRQLKYYLEKNNMTQNELAKRIGVGNTSVYNWCNGLKSPRMDKVDAMCKIFDCRRSDLMEPYANTNTTDYSATATPEEFENLVKPYRNLDDSGKKHINYELRREADRMNRIAQLEYIVTNISGDSYVNAANERTDIEITKEMQSHDDDIMNEKHF